MGGRNKGRRWDVCVAVHRQPILQLRYNLQLQLKKRIPFPFPNAPLLPFPFPWTRTTLAIIIMVIFFPSLHFPRYDGFLFSQCILLSLFTFHFVGEITHIYLLHTILYLLRRRKIGLENQERQFNSTQSFKYITTFLPFPSNGGQMILKISGSKWNSWKKYKNWSLS